jgi:hypothetical protein
MVVERSCELHVRLSFFARECATEVLAKPKCCQAHKFAGLNFNDQKRTFEDDHPTTTDKISNAPAICIAEGLRLIRSVKVTPFPTSAEASGQSIFSVS